MKCTTTPDGKCLTSRVEPHLCRAHNRSRPRDYPSNPAVRRTASPITRNRSSRTSLPSVAVAILSHNYGQYLAAAIDSVLTQTVSAAEIVVIDDSSTDNTAEVARSYAGRGVRYIRHDGGHVHLSREIGLRETTAECLVWLDADDTLPPDYLARGLLLFADRNVGLVYSDFQTFGIEDAIRRFPDPEQVDLSRRNSCHAGSIARRTAIESTTAFDGTVPVRQTHCDWLVWRRIQQAGWTVAKNAAVYNYRKHPAGMMKTAEKLTWPELLMAESEPLTLWIPLSGRTRLWPGLRDWLDRQTWPRESIRLVLCDTSQDPEFSRMIRDDLHALDWPDARYCTLTAGVPGVADADRHQRPVKREVQRAVSRIYRTMQRDVTTDYVLVIEDDIIPPDNAISLLWQGMGADVASVTGIYRSRYHGHVVAYGRDHRSIEPTGQDIVDVTYNGFGCVLLRTALLREIGIAGEPPTYDYDQTFYRHLAGRRDWSARANWQCQCQHLE